MTGGSGVQCQQQLQSEFEVILGYTQIIVMWEAPLCALNVLLPLVNKEAALTYDKAE